MNLMPVMVDKHANTPVSNTSKSSSGSENKGQASEFESVLSDSLAKQSPLNNASEATQESISTLQASQAGGEALPLAGESLPPASLANTAIVISEDNLLEGIDAAQAGEAALEATTSASAQALSSEAVDVLPGELLAGVTVQAASTSVTTTSNLLGESADKLPGQLNLQARQTTTGAVLTPQAMTPISLGNSTQTAAGDQGLNSQSQTSTLMPELTASTTIEDKLDFSRLIDKGLVHHGKETASTQLISTLESTKPGLGAVKSATDSLLMQHSIDKPKWSSELGSRMVWLSKEGVQSAQLKLTPAHLGTIDVKISIQNDQATVSFLSQHGAVRDAIESSLPRLREMMQEAGVKLEQANISNHSNANAQQQSAHSGKTSGQSMHGNSVTGEDGEELTDSSTTSIIQTSDLSAIDFYA